MLKKKKKKKEIRKSYSVPKNKMLFKKRTGAV